MSPASKAQQKAVAKYESNNYDKILIRVPKGKRDEYRSYAEKQGMSLNGFIVDAVEERIGQDNPQEGGKQENADHLY